MIPTIGVIQFPGSNCERETRMAIERVGMHCTDIFWNTPLSALTACDGYILIGGFSFEDRLRSGVIASLNPLIQSLKDQALKHKPILGICNGAQILMEAGLVPGLKNYQIGGALYTNKRTIDDRVVEGGYYNEWARIKPANVCDNHAFTNQFKPEQSIYVPFAHAQGRFVLPNDLLAEMKNAKSSLFHYVEENPNGSVDNLAAISNKAGNVMGMMPHPERCEAGDVIFSSMKQYILSDLKKDVFETYHYSFQPQPFNSYTPTENTYSLMIELLIEDNTAKSLELVLRQQGYDCNVKRYQYYEIDDTSPKEASLLAIKESAELFNESKERVATLEPHSLSLLVSDKEDVLGKQKTKTLQTVFGMSSLNSVKKGIVYTFDLKSGEKETLNAFLSESHLLYNPYVQDCYDYTR